MITNWLSGVPPFLSPSSIACPTSFGICTWKIRPMNEITSDEMKMPLCASTIGIARFSHDWLRSPPMLFLGGG